MDRHLPRVSELRALMAPAPRAGTRRQRRMARAADVADLRELARRRTPRAVFDYVDGAAEEEISLARAVQAFRDLELVPHIMRDVSTASTTSTVLGRKVAMPVVLAPTGFTRMMHTEGELAVARAAREAGVPYTLSTMGTTSPEDVARVGGDLWFQLYLWRDRERSRDLVQRVATSGFRVLVVTVDTAVAGARQRDVRNGMTIPATLRARTLLDGLLHPAYWADLLTTDAFRFAAFDSAALSAAELMDSMFDPAITVDDIGWLRGVWDGPIVIKGIQTAEDAARVVQAGADAVVVSNHGGRQLDRAPVPLEVLPSVLDAVGSRAEVLLDTGVRNGGDVVAALALGARAVMVGRAYLWGLMAGGLDGVRRSTEILSTDLTRTLRLMGVDDVLALRPEHVRRRPPPR